MFLVAMALKFYHSISNNEIQNSMFQWEAFKTRGAVAK